MLIPAIPKSLLRTGTLHPDLDPRPPPSLQIVNIEQHRDRVRQQKEFVVNLQKVVNAVAIGRDDAGRHLQPLNKIGFRPLAAEHPQAIGRNHRAGITWLNRLR